jgi:hypothetical protein
MLHHRLLLSQETAGHDMYVASESCANVNASTLAFYRNAMQLRHATWLNTSGVPHSGHKMAQLRPCNLPFLLTKRTAICFLTNCLSRSLPSPTEHQHATALEFTLGLKTHQTPLRAVRVQLV